MGFAGNTVSMLSSCIPEMRKLIFTIDFGASIRI